MTAVADMALDDVVARALAARIPEVADGAVHVVATARVSGECVKVAVSSTRRGLDAAGLCIGVGGGRIRDVEALLGGERVTIVAFDADPRSYIRNALGVETSSIALDPRQGIARVVVDHRAFRTAIGKGGFNVRLASWLTGWHIQLCTNECCGTNHVHPGARSAPSPTTPEEFGS